MYRIELSPGEETAFRSIEELAVAIRRKVVTSRARIYHNATSKWLPIQFHPHYKIACSMPLTQADLVAGPPVAPLSTLKLGDQQSQGLSSVPPAPSNRPSATQAALTAWPEPKPSSPSPAAPPVRDIPKPTATTVPPIQLGTPAPEPLPAREIRRVEPRAIEPRAPVIEPRRIVEPVRTAPPALRAPEARAVESRSPEPTTGRRSRRRKTQRVLRVGLAAAVVLAFVHLAISGASSVDGTALARTRTPRQLIEAPAEALKDLTPRTVAAVMPVLQSIPVPALTSSSSPEPVVKKAAVATTGFPRQVAVVAAAPKPAVVDTAPSPEIEAAPEVTPVLDAKLSGADALTPPVMDSSSKTTLNRVLRTITSPPARNPARR